MIIEEFNEKAIEAQVDHDLSWASEVTRYDKGKIYSHNAKISAGKLIMFILDNKQALLKVQEYARLREQTLNLIVNNDHSDSLIGEQIEMFTGGEV